MPMTLAFSNNDTNLTHRVVRRFISDVIADPAKELVRFEAMVKPFLDGEGEVRRVQAIFQEFLKVRDEEMTGGGDFSRSNSFVYVLKKNELFVSSIRSFFRGGRLFQGYRSVAYPMFLAIVQQYALPPRIRTGIEAATRFWGKTKMLVRLKARSPYSREADVEYLEAYLKLCAELRKQIELANVAIKEGGLHGAPDTETKIKVGSFTLVNTGGFDAKVMANVADLVEKAEKAMRGVGLGKVCYGDILVTKTLAKANIMAFYLIASDEMFVRANVKPHWDTVQTVCHELCHRLQFKFLAGKRAEINSVYRTIAHENRITRRVPTDMYPKPGDTMNDPKIGEIKAYAVDYQKGVIMGETVPNPASGAVLRYKVPVSMWLKATGKELPVAEDFKGFVTPYAGKDADENFAEMTSYYAMGKLPKSQIPLLEAILT